MFLLTILLEVFLPTENTKAFMKKIIPSLLMVFVLIFNGAAIASSPKEQASSKKTYVYLPDVEENPSKPWNVPNQCEGIERKDGKYKRIRKEWTEEDEQRFQKIIEIVAREMGADPKIFYLWGRREGDFRPSTLMLKIQDVRANRNAWRDHKWTKEKEEELLEIMRNSPQRGPGSEVYYQARAKYNKIQKYKNNPWYDYTRTYINEWGKKKEINTWHYGHGSFGMNTTLYVRLWDRQAPPWILCYDEGIISVVVVIWAARKQLDHCRRQGYPQTYGVLDRRFSSGHCSKQYSKGFLRRAKKLGMRPNAKPRLGDKWDQETTNRHEIYEHMRTTLENEGVIEKRE